MLPAITDVLRATSPQHQRYGYENQVNTGTRSLPRTATPPKSSYAETISQYPTDNFATYICCPNTTDYNRHNSLMPPNVPPTSRQLPTTSGNTTPPGLDSVFDMGVGSVAQLKVARVEPNILVVVGSTVDRWSVNLTVALTEPSLAATAGLMAAVPSVKQKLVIKLLSLMGCAGLTAEANAVSFQGAGNRLFAISIAYFEVQGVKEVILNC
ncbi:hypothetical protein PInf_019159 [Phytophthora infestans]|nr:hypothetical protein PInf_019159 [Phytophthora infestans]